MINSHNNGKTIHNEDDKSCESPVQTISGLESDSAHITKVKAFILVTDADFACF